MRHHQTTSYCRLCLSLYFFTYFTLYIYWNRIIITRNSIHVNSLPRTHNSFIYTHTPIPVVFLVLITQYKHLQVSSQYFLLYEPDRERESKREVRGKGEGDRVCVLLVTATIHGLPNLSFLELHAREPHRNTFNPAPLEKETLIKRGHASFLLSHFRVVTQARSRISRPW